MKNLNKCILAYLKWTSPIALLAAVLSSMEMSGGTFFYDLIGWITMVWIVFLIYTVFNIALSSQQRDSFVRWISGIKENDEREAIITGEVSKKTFIFMTGILTLLLFLSVIKINIYRNTDTINGKNNGSITFGMGLRFVESENKSPVIDDLKRSYIVKYSGLPLTSDGTLIVIMFLQVGAFYYFSRKIEYAE